MATTPEELLIDSFNTILGDGWMIQGDEMDIPLNMLYDKLMGKLTQAKEQWCAEIIDAIFKIQPVAIQCDVTKEELKALILEFIEP